MDTLFDLTRVSSENNNDFNIDITELDDNNTKAPQLQKSVILRPHQLTLLQRCIEYENECIKLKDFNLINSYSKEEDKFNTHVGIIGDRVGSGKSYIILALIATNNIINKDITIIKSTGLNNVNFYFTDTKKVIKTNLLVIPHNLCNQWENYIKNFKLIEKYKLIYTNKALSLLKNEIDNDNFTPDDLVIVSSTYYNKVALLYNEKKLKLQRVIFDETDNINIPNCINIYANFIWFVSASYGNLIFPRGFIKYDRTIHQYIYYANGIHNNGFIKDIFTDLYTKLPIELTKTLIIKNKEAYVNLSLNLPEFNKYKIRCKTPATINILNGLVDKNIIISLNAGDIKTALLYVKPSNKGDEENIIKLIIDKYSKQIHNLQLRLTMIDNMHYDDERDRISETESLNNNITKLNNTINLIKERIAENDTCPICLDEISNKTITNCCQQSFCFKCIHLSLNVKLVCPYCKHSLLTTDLFVVNPSTQIADVNFDELNELFDKLTNLEILLKKKKDGKILIFSNAENSFHNISRILYKNNIKFDCIKGNTNQINSIINKYKTGDLNVLLINTTNYGTGMNLENTTDIIMFHQFNTQIEEQIIGRAQRLGRKEPLNVYYLLYDNEYTN